MLTEKEQEFLYSCFINGLCNKENNGKDLNQYSLDKLHKLNLIRKLKKKYTNEKKIQLTKEGEIIAIIIARFKGNFKANRVIIDYIWYK